MSVMSPFRNIARTVVGAPAAALAGLGIVAGGAATGYLTALTFLGAGRRSDDRCPAADVPRTRFAILVPAHDEAATISDTLGAFERLDYPRRLFEVHVVADNCTDATAEVVRGSGWRVHERDEPESPGKGPALNWLFDRLQAEPFDVAVIVDADTLVAPGFLLALDRAFDDDAVVAQGFYSVRDPHASPGAAVRFAALAARHHLRPAGRMRLGGSCGLFGNGMAFHRSVLERHRWTGHLIEDMELQIELLLDDDIHVRYVPDAEVIAEIPDNLESATPQNRRWERGRVLLAREGVPALVRATRGSPRSRRIALLDATADLLVPPISVLGVVHTCSATFGLVATVTGNRHGPKLTMANSILAVLLAGHVVVALWSVRAPRSVYAGLRGLPRMVIWKARLWAGVLRDDDVEWTRTERNAASAPDGEAQSPPAKPGGGER